MKLTQFFKKWVFIIGARMEGGKGGIRRWRNSKGFTLVELLAVMAILGILAGMVGSSVPGTLDTSQPAQDQKDPSRMETEFTDGLAESPAEDEILSQLREEFSKMLPKEYWGQLEEKKREILNGGFVLSVLNEVDKDGNGNITSQELRTVDLFAISKNVTHELKLENNTYDIGSQDILAKLVERLLIKILYNSGKSESFDFNINNTNLDFLINSADVVLTPAQQNTNQK